MPGVLIIGAGLAGSRCAETLRAGGFDGRIALAGAEGSAPYERPALSKQLLTGARTAASLALRPDQAWRENEIDLRLDTPITYLDLTTRRALTSTGETLRFEVLVIATGARARRLDALSHLPRVSHLRTIADATGLRERLTEGDRLAIIGAGLIGAEVASTVLALGVTPILIEAGETPLERAFGRDVGALLAEQWRTAGVSVRTGAQLRDVRADLRGRVGALALSDDSIVECDHVLVAIGSVPETRLVDSLLERAPDGGIATDSHGRTSMPDVFACGDVASWHRESIGRSARAENWTSAANQAAIVARTILGDAATRDEPFYAWSDQFGLRLQHVSTGEAWEEVAIERYGDAFEARYLDRDGRLVAALVANRPGAIAAFRRDLAPVSIPA